MVERREPPSLVTNEQIAETLHQVADLLEAQNANPLRTSAYRLAAQTVRDLQQPASVLLEQEGTEGLKKLPGIGRSISNSMAQLITTGHLPLLDRIKGDFRTERLFATVPDIGQGLAHKIHEELHIETLAELQAAAEDGRLASIKGMGPKRIQAVVESLRGRLRGSRSQPNYPYDTAATALGAERASFDVSVTEILSIDEEYRRLAKANRLPLVAPQRFNPTGAAWLPILHTHRENRHYSALFSNTARAHELGTTHDWVVIYRDDQESQGRWTVITAQFGSLRGKRIVRGRESECAMHYEQTKQKDA